ncbi:NUDIX domain-containing protein [Streptomyces albidoflavus]|uniref:NUDIX domain-containing protein n=1 Tax=Streptomyces albidoflavus TaxID=1886 RepID=UPI0033C63B26
MRCSAATASGASCWGKSSSRLVRHAFWRHSNPVVETRKGAAITEETGITVPAHEFWQLGAYDEPGRDPRGRYVTVAYTATVAEPCPPVPATDALEARWFPFDDMPKLAFDHHRIITDATRGGVGA